MCEADADKETSLFDSLTEGLTESKLYFDMGEAVDDVRQSYGGKEVAMASGKLAGKGLSNTLVFAGKLSFNILKNARAISTEMRKEMERQKEKRAKSAGE
ncbi:hypothetical protein CO611_00275 [Lysobacteraceae bacterium NML03-0222]|nr:hypothetical protein CO611_00275 [Xanthomonadaceae bacterium NML03-0222]